MPDGPTTAEWTDRQPVHDWPLYWFAELARAVENGDFAAAAAAQAELERLGVTVCYRPRTAMPQAVWHA